MGNADMHAPHRVRAVNIQGWHDLTFLHWAYAPEAIQALLPPGLRVETSAGHAWVGVTPFRMHAVRPVGLPPLPHLSSFPEVNCRTYVRHENGTSGISACPDRADHRTYQIYQVPSARHGSSRR